MKHRIDRLNSHIGDYDGELTNLKMKVEFTEAEMDKLATTIKRLRDDNRRLQGVRIYIACITFLVIFASSMSSQSICYLLFSRAE